MFLLGRQTALHKKNISLLWIICLLLTWLVWAGFKPEMNNFKVDYPSRNISTSVTLPVDGTSDAGVFPFNLSGVLYYLPWQSGWVRIIPDNCVKEIFVNDVLVDPSLYSNPELCYPGVITLNLSPYLSTGRNTFLIKLTDDNEQGGRYGVNLIQILSAPLAFAKIGLVAFWSYLLWQSGRRIYQYLPQFNNSSGTLLGVLFKQLKSNRNRAKSFILCTFAVVLLLAVAVIGRAYYFDFESGDIRCCVSRWVSHIRKYGLTEAYMHSFSNYMPFYTYILGIADFFMPTLQPMYASKIASFFGEILASWYVYRLVKRYKPSSGFLPYLGALAMLASPSVIANSAAAGQCDVWYTVFILASVLAIIEKRYPHALLWAGLGVSVKLQAIFIAPFLFAFVLNRQIPYKLLYLPFVAFFATMIPALLQGRPLLDIVLVYYRQAGNYDFLGNAANFYFLLEGIEGAELRHAIVIGGVLSAAFIAIAYSYFISRVWKPSSDVVPYILLATLSVALMPYLLPKMLDRYFYMADVFSLILAIMRPRWIMITVLFQFSSLLTQPTWQVPFIWQITGWEEPFRQRLASICSTINIVVLLMLCYKHVWKAESRQVTM
jgi:Gpi18-like mannosyltransferase